MKKIRPTKKWLHAVFPPAVGVSGREYFLFCIQTKGHDYDHFIILDSGRCCIIHLVKDTKIGWIINA